MSDIMDRLPFLRSAERRPLSLEAASAIEERKSTINWIVRSTIEAVNREFPEQVEIQPLPQLPEASWRSDLGIEHAGQITELGIERARQAVERARFGGQNEAA